MRIFRVRYRIVKSGNSNYIVQFRLFFMLFYSDIYGSFDSVSTSESFIRAQRSDRVIVRTDKEI